MQVKPIDKWQVEILWTNKYLEQCRERAKANPLLNYREWTITNAKHNEKYRE